MLETTRSICTIKWQKTTYSVHFTQRCAWEYRSICLKLVLSFATDEKSLERLIPNPHFANKHRSKWNFQGAWETWRSSSRKLDVTLTREGLEHWWSLSSEAEISDGAGNKMCPDSNSALPQNKNPDIYQFNFGNGIRKQFKGTRAKLEIQQNGRSSKLHGEKQVTPSTAHAEDQSNTPRKIQRICT